MILTGLTSDVSDFALISRLQELDHDDLLAFILDVIDDNKELARDLIEELSEDR
jgi:hypothetical protein